MSTHQTLERRCLTECIKEREELREVNAELLAAMKLIYDNSMDEQAMLIAGRAIAKAERPR